MNEDLHFACVQHNIPAHIPTGGAVIQINPLSGRSRRSAHRIETDRGLTRAKRVVVVPREGRDGTHIVRLEPYVREAIVLDLYTATSTEVGNGV